jgi:hypothetical protein
MKFFLGTNEPAWLAWAGVPLFVSHIRLRRRIRLPIAIAPWSLDSGGFTELSRHGHWTTTPQEYVEAVDRYATGVGQLVWASPQDWMCEPHIVAKTGLSVREHQERTVESYLLLRDLAPEQPIIPVVQGWTLDDYLLCVELYAEAGVDLETRPLVGVGSVCRRQRSSEISEIMGELHGLGLKLHGFGVKGGGLEIYSDRLESSDSMAWSMWARRENIRLPDCLHKYPDCRSCVDWALEWRRRLLSKVN